MLRYSRIHCNQIRPVCHSFVFLRLTVMCRIYRPPFIIFCCIISLTVKIGQTMRCWYYWVLLPHRLLLSTILLPSHFLAFQPLPIVFPGNPQPRASSWSSVMSISQSSSDTIQETILDFPDDIWDDYVKIMSEVMQSSRVLKKDKLETVKVVQEYLISRKSLLEVPSPKMSDRQSFQDEMTRQASMFQRYYNFTQTQYNFAMRSLVYFGDTCAKQKLGLPVMVCWHKLKEAGMIPRENSISTYMYILSNEEDSVIGRDALEELATFHDLIYSPNEKTVFLRMKTMIAKNDIAGAEGILFSLPDKGEEGVGEWKRLRTFLPILEYYCSVGNGSSILRLLRDMRQSSGVYMDADTYAMIIGSLARFGWFSKNAAPIEGFQDAGFSSSHGPLLFDEVMGQMSDDILELTESSAKQMMFDLSTGFGGKLSDPGNNHEIPNFTSHEEPRSSGLHLGKVDIGVTTGVCPASGAKLRLFRLDEDQRQHVHNTLLEMARLSYQEFTRKRQRGDDEDQDYGFQQLAHFSQWLDEREGDPFTAVVDGANVAYFGFPELHYSQVRLVVDELKRMGETPLVVLPKKYTYRTFMLSSTGKSQTLPDRDYNIIQSLKDEGILYIVPPRCLDDYFWMLASVSNQTVARNKCDLQVAPENADGRFPGLRPMLVTNDRMRDHKLDLLNPREFRRWSSSHIVNYNVTPYIENEWEESRSVQFSPADFFSREIQGNLHENNKDVVWHIPITEWEEPARFCIWIDR